MSLDKLLTTVRHSCTPYTSDLYLRFISQKMEWYPEIHWPWEIEEIVQNDRKRYYQGLADFRAVDARQNVYAIGCEGRQ